LPLPYRFQTVWCFGRAALCRGIPVTLLNPYHLLVIQDRVDDTFFGVTANQAGYTPQKKAATEHGAPSRVTLFHPYSLSFSSFLPPAALPGANLFLI